MAGEGRPKPGELDLTGAINKSLNSGASPLVNHRRADPVASSTCTQGSPMRGYKRIAILADDRITPEPSKTFAGVLRYRMSDVVTVIDRGHAGQALGTVMELGADHSVLVVRDVRAALAYQPDALLLADEPVRPMIQPYWRDQVLYALESGLDVINGLHYLLAEDEALRGAARRTGANIWDLRRPPRERYSRPVGVRRRRPDSRTILAVGTDCSSGKMTTMLEVERNIRARGADSFFLATGQIGMMITGSGVPVDAITVDFVNSVVEDFVFQAAEEHDIVLVEGQGALNHPRYSAVTLGLLHGTRPDSLILCHDLRRMELELPPHSPLPSLQRAIELNEQAAAWTWPEDACRVVGISLITTGLSDSEAAAHISRIRSETGLPVTDVVRHSADVLADAIMAAPRAGD